AASRNFFEPRFGLNFGNVRIHNDARADVSARAVRALAYTVGSHVVFRADMFSPGSATGRSLLAHELAHVVQQSGAGSRHSLSRLPASNGLHPRAAREEERPAELEADTEPALSVGAVADEVERQAGQTPATDGRGGDVVNSAAPSPEEDPEVARSAGPIPSNTVTCVKKWQPCRAPYSPGTWAARMTYHCPRLLLPWGIILPGTTQPAFATIPDEFIGVSPTGRDMYRCRPRVSVNFKAMVADAAAFAVTRRMLFFGQGACHAGFRANLLLALE